MQKDYFRINSYLVEVVFECAFCLGGGLIFKKQRQIWSSLAIFLWIYQSLTMIQINVGERKL